MILKVFTILLVVVLVYGVPYIFCELCFKIKLFLVVDANTTDCLQLNVYVPTFNCTVASKGCDCVFAVKVIGSL